MKLGARAASPEALAIASRKRCVEPVAAIDHHPAVSFTETDARSCGRQAA
jgi:hypothetical protein